MGCHSVCENQGVKSVYRSEQKESKGAGRSGAGTEDTAPSSPGHMHTCPHPASEQTRRHKAESPPQGFSEEGWPPRGALWLLRSGLVSPCSQGQRLRGWGRGQSWTESSSSARTLGLPCPLPASPLHKHGTRALHSSRSLGQHICSRAEDDTQSQSRECRANANTH